MELRNRFDDFISICYDFPSFLIRAGFSLLIFDQKRPNDSTENGIVQRGEQVHPIGVVDRGGLRSFVERNETQKIDGNQLETGKRPRPREIKGKIDQSLASESTF